MRELWIILGAGSAMARAFARDLSKEGHSLILCGRDTGDLDRNAVDATLRGAERAEVHAFDLRNAESWDPVIETAAAFDGTVNVAVFAGSMPPQEAVEADPALFDGMVMDNFTGSARFLLAMAPQMARRGAGVVVGVGSVAGDRGRLSNYAYGSAKAGFHTFLAGHRNRMARQGVHVMTVKPGFVDTAMTWGLEGMFLVASPADISVAIRKGLRKKRNVIYAPVFWWGIMTIIKSVPEFIFKKLKI